MNYTEPKVTTERFGGDDKLKYEHECFGNIEISKVSSSPGSTLFGSALKHGHYITLEIKRAELNRNLNRDWIFGRGTIVKVALSEAQWSSMISSQGMGSGTPCTIERAPEPGTPIRMMDGLISEPTKKTFDEEIKKKCAQFVEKSLESVSKLEDIANGKTVSKVELREAIKDLKISLQNLPSNMSFTQKMFVEAMEKTVEAGKVEMETFVSNLAMRTGLDALRNQSIQLAAEEKEVPPQISVD